MKRIVTGRRMKVMDQTTIREMGIPSCVLMERAALAVAEEVKKTHPIKVLVLCGNGNNGGDGVAIARILHLWGIPSEFCMVKNPGNYTEETKRQIEIARNYQVRQVNNPRLDEYTTIVDAVFGIGLSRPVEGIYKEVIRKVNETKACKIAVDIPSGICADTGGILGIAVKADVTVTFGYMKRGHCFYPGASYAGKILVKDIGIYPGKEDRTDAWMLEEKDKNWLPPRKEDGNKGTFGKVLVVAGSKNMAGAAYLSARACLYAGCGMVKILTEEENRIILQGLLPEAMLAAGEEEQGWQEALDWCDAMVIGPGLGKSIKSRQKTQWFLKNCRKPMVADADALNLLSENREWEKWLSPRCILTPHMGEMERLCKKSVQEIKKDRIGEACRLAEKLGIVCVLKDARTVIADERGNCWLNGNGNAGMATAGSGDVLSGIIGALLGNGMEQMKAAVLGNYLHGRSGDLARGQKGERSMTAQDLIEFLPETFAEMEKNLC